MSQERAKIERYLPYVLATFLASIGVYIYAMVFPEPRWYMLLLQWLYYFAAFSGTWHLNRKFNQPFKPLTLGLNVCYICLVALGSALLFPATTMALSALRLTMPTILFITIQQSFKVRQQSEKLKIENLQLRAENYKAELENLKRQLNPHFLFNSLSTLQAVIRTNPSLAEKYVLQLSELYRSSLHNSHLEKINVKEELRFVESYLFLQQIRFEKALICDISVNEACGHHLVPSFAVQLLVENCIKHNVVSREAPLHIHIDHPDEVSLRVSNNLQPKQQESLPSEHGLANLSKRYELLGIANGVSIEKTEKSFTVTLKLF